MGERGTTVSPLFHPPPVGHLSKHQQSTPEKGRKIVQSLQLAPLFWRAAWHLREAAPTMGGMKQGGNRNTPALRGCEHDQLTDQQRH